jgi:hypothetical protein
MLRPHRGRPHLQTLLRRHDRPQAGRTARRNGNRDEAGDCPQFVPLVKETAKRFEIGEVSADKAYASIENCEEIAVCGGQAFIAFKSNTAGAVGGVFEKAFHFFQFNQEEYMAHYHKRSNFESTFSAIKRRFGDSVMSENDVAMVNEVLCKILCRNLTCLIQEQETLGIVPDSLEGCR